MEIIEIVGYVFSGICFVLGTAIIIWVATNKELK